MHDHVVTRVRRRWPAPLLGAMGSLAVALAACAAPAGPQAAAPPDATHEPSTSTAKPTLRRTRNEFLACLEHAADGPGRRACLDSELAHEQRALESVAAVQSGADLESLQARQRTWDLETDQLCGGPADPASLTAEQALCRFDRSFTRFGTLLAASDSGASMSATTMPETDGSLELRLGDVAVALRSEGCARSDGAVRCHGAELTLSGPHMTEQTIVLQGIWLPVPGGGLPTALRVPAAVDFIEGWLPAITIFDANADGREDLIVWTGREGSYGDPSYAYYMYDAASGRLVEDAHLARLVEGHSLSRIVDGRLFAWYRSGPCDRGEKTIDLRRSPPAVVDRKGYSTCGGSTGQD
jgi:hypothetical protein